MEPDEAQSTALDDFLDRVIRGEAVSAEAFLEAHPELSHEDRRLVLGLCGRAQAGDGPKGEPAPAEVRPAVAPPLERIGTFRLGRRIGSGGMGAVFLAEDEALGREVAVKILGPDLTATGERSDRFLREVRAVARLRHPNIVTVHAAGEQDGLRYMVMEHVPGSSLQDILSDAATSGTRPPASDVLRWGIEIAHALQAAHEAGIVHRDVKPSNIRITPAGRAVLLDFGLARDAGAATVTESGVFQGSPQYASPEQVGLSGAPIDTRTDVYSLGATLYEATTGVAPFRGETRDQLFHQILTRDPLPPRKLDPAIPRDLETVILAALEKDPARRLSSAAALANDLEAIRDGRPVSVRPPSPVERAARWARRNPAKAALVLAAAALAGAAVAIVSMGGFIRTNLPRIQQAEADEKTRAFEALLAEGFLEYGEGDREIARTLFDRAMLLAPESVEAKAGYALASRPQDSASAFLAGLPPAMNTAGWVDRIRDEIAKIRESPEAAASRAAPPPPKASASEHFITGVLLLGESHRSEGNARVSAAYANRAFESLRQAILSSSAAKAAYHYELGHAAWHAGRHADAREIAGAIEQLWPESPTQWFAIGRTLIEADHEAALTAFQKAVARPPHAGNARGLMALQLCEFDPGPERIAQALTLARGVVADFPQAARAHAMLGVVLMKDGKTEPAIEALSEAVRLEPESGEAHRVLAQAFLRTGRPDRAIASAREAARLTPMVSQSWLILGIVLLRTGAVDEGIRNLERSIELNPRSADALIQLGTALLIRGDLEPGLARLKEGYEIGSKDPTWMSRVSRMIAQAERVLEMQRAVLRGFGEDPAAPGDPAERLRLREQARIRFEEDLAEAEREIARDPSQLMSATARLRSWAGSRAAARVKSPDAEDVMTSDEIARWRDLWTRYEKLLQGGAETNPLSR